MSNKTVKLQRTGARTASLAPVLMVGVAVCLMPSISVAHGTDRSVVIGSTTPPAGAVQAAPAPVHANTAMTTTVPERDLTKSFVISPAATIAVPTKDPFQIEARADNLHVDPVIAIAMNDGVRTAVRGKDAHFLTYTNYPSSINHGEVRLFDGGKASASIPLAIVPLDPQGAAKWTAPEVGPETLFYVLRVYDAAGHFDETRPVQLTLLNKPLAQKSDANRPFAGTIDEAAIRNIPIHGVTVTVTGKADADTDIVRLSGQIVPIDKTGHFVARQIVARDRANVDITVERRGKIVMDAHRSFAFARHDWFVVGQGEVTIGNSHAIGPVAAVSGNTLAQGSYAAGRAAFYAKGIVGDDIKVTSSLDTGEALVSDLFRNLDRKNPMQLLGRLNRDQYYPTYGDDSTLSEDAPTQGRFFLRVQKNASQLVVGNFITAIKGTDLAQLDRGLFGALVDLNSNGATSFGERKTQVTAFASDPGTIPGRDELRGTGGSLYFLSRQDISIGSERITVEIRDQTSGIVLQSQPLSPQEDYVIDPFQGRITLLHPLSSYAAVSDTVRRGASSGNIPVLVANYEYTPAVGDVSGYTLGGRATHWLGEYVRLGATAQRDTSGGADLTLLGSDVLLRYAAGTYFKAEIARTTGPGTAQSNSVDGGLNYTNIATPGTIGTSANAWRVEGAVDVAELEGKKGSLGKASGYYQHTEAGFSSSGQLALNDISRWGVAASLPVTSSTQIVIKADQLTNSATGTNRTAALDISQHVGANLVAKLGMRSDSLVPGLLYNSVQSGNRTDAALQIAYAPKGQNSSVYAFGQATLDHGTTRAKNDRVGVGGKLELSDTVSLSGEVSEGSGGVGASILLNHKLSQDSETYIGYVRVVDQSHAGLEPQNLFNPSSSGMLTVGSRQRFTDALSVNGEQRLGIGGSAPSIDRIFGMKFEPSKHLSFTGSFEAGQIDDATTGLFKRTAATLGFGYSEDHFKFGSSIEGRFDRGFGRDENVWLIRNNLEYGINPDWRFIGHLNVAMAKGDQVNVTSANFVEGVAGFAYRPVRNTRLNALVRLTYFEDKGPIGQITGSGAIQSPKQISRVVSIDVNYDLTSNLTVGAKYGYRDGSVSLSRSSDVFVNSNAQLGVVRADYRVARRWDALIEARILIVPVARDNRIGVLGTIYRHLNDHVKIGAGYSLSAFSDDLTDQSYSSHGPFVNLIGKF